MDHHGYDQFPSNLLGCDLMQDASPDMSEILNYWSLYPVFKPHSESKEIKMEPCNGIEVTRKVHALNSHIRQQTTESGLDVKVLCKSTTSELHEVKTEDSMWPDTPDLSENTPAHVSTCQKNEFGNAVKDTSPISTRDQLTPTVAEPAAADRSVASVTQEPRGSSDQVALHQQSSTLQQEITPSGLNDLSANHTRHINQHHADVNQEQSALNSMQPTTTPGSFNSAPSGLMYNYDEMLKAIGKCPLCAEPNDSHQQQEKRSQKDEGKRGKIKPWKCCSCKKTFVREFSLKCHRRMHLNAYVECPECKQRFLYRFNLEKHVSTTHSKEKPNSCSDCDQSFRTVSELNQHILFKHASPKHICEECGKGFILKTALQLHMNVHTGDRPYQCPDCDFIFKAPAALKAHRIVHTTERPFPCPKCPSRFRSKANLKTHLTRHTSSKGPQKSAKRRSRRQAESSDSEEASPSDTNSPHDSSPPGSTTRETRSWKTVTQGVLC